MFGFGKDKKNESRGAAAVSAEALPEALRNALGKIMDPALGRDLQSLGAIRDLNATPEKVAVTVELHAHSHPARDQIEQEVKKAVSALAPDAKVEVKMTAHVRAAGGALWNKQGVRGVKNIILVASGKGGVGKSTVASNLAVALSRDGAQVGLLDADVYGPSIPTMFGLTGGVRPSSNDGKTMEPLTRHGLKLISIGFLVDANTPMVWRGPMIASACMQLFNDVAWAPLDYLVVDLPPGTGDIQLTISQKVAVAGAVVVSTPQDVALADVIRAKAMFDKVGIPTLGLVENMSFFICDKCDKRHEIFDTGGARRSAERLEVPFLGALPIEIPVRQGGDEGTPVVVRNPESEAAKAMRNVAAEVAIKVAQLAADAPREEPPPPATKSPLLKVLG
ncbi:MAG: iron-sulfur cluster carrier protein ApbC [Myxococcota bacterium]